MFNRKWSKEIAASFSFFSSSVPTFINTLILRFISIVGTKYLILCLHISPQGGTLVPVFVYFNSPIRFSSSLSSSVIYLKDLIPKNGRFFWRLSSSSLLSHTVGLSLKSRGRPLFEVAWSASLWSRMVGLFLKSCGVPSCAGGLSSKLRGQPHFEVARSVFLWSSSFLATKNGELLSKDDELFVGINGFDLPFLFSTGLSLLT